MGGWAFCSTLQNREIHSEGDLIRGIQSVFLAGKIQNRPWHRLLGPLISGNLALIVHDTFVSLNSLILLDQYNEPTKAGGPKCPFLTTSFFRVCFLALRMCLTG